VNGNSAKPSRKVRAGDVVHALIAERKRIVQLVRPHTFFDVLQEVREEHPSLRARHHRVTPPQLLTPVHVE